MKHKRIIEMTPTEFEKCCCDILTGYAESEGLKDFKIIHNKYIKAHDGKYQIDVYAEFTAMHTTIKVLCECKRYKNRVNREKVAALHRKIESVGAHKGILITTSNFQSGAIDYAQKHGIALIKAEDNDFKNISYSNGDKEMIDDPFIIPEKLMPDYVAYDYTSETAEPHKVFPTKTMVKEILVEMTKRINAEYDTDISLSFPE